MIYYRRYVGDFQRKTMRLDPTDIGVYDLMLDYCYAEEQPLPIEIDDIYSICKVSKPEHRKSVAKVLKLYFEAHADGYHNKRVDEEIAVSKQARTNGKGGGRPRTGTITGLQTGSETKEQTEPRTGTITGGGGGSGHPSTTNHQPSAFQPSTASHQPPEKTKTARKKRALSPVPEDWKPTERTATRLRAEFALPSDGIDRYTVAFIDICASKGHEYASPDAAFANCVRQDWPKFRANGAMAPRKKTAAEMLDEEAASRARLQAA